MVRTSIVHVLLFIAAVSISTMFVGVVVTEAGLYAQSTESESERDVAAIDAEIDLINDPEAGTTYAEDDGDGSLTLYVKNVGGSSLDPGDADVLLNGEYVSPADSRLLSDGDVWRVDSVLEVTVPTSTALEPGDHRAVVEIDGAREILEFEHRVANWDWNEFDGLDGQNSTVEDCGPEECTVVLDESDDDPVLEMPMETVQPQPDESVSYESSNGSVGAFDGETETAGTTDGDGTDGVTLSLDETGETTVTLDAGWDADAITIYVEAEE
ncbi:flagellin [Natronolimnohabitans innermongolicus]|uniref:Flagellin n=1 Tax=Natronolimnohabitans innermongolicus JCM 12255 TaxID=1227499 RepID=L9X0Y3_9EURY|nr:flagellin [Natronolimnohabitans innermongolicus]ELY54258.1 flagellin [Natronolimnohabitans innermongolicus JCM 12255]